MTTQSAAKLKKETTAACPCGTGKSLIECCLPLIQGKMAAPTAETLMRSRYTAFAVGDMDYIFETTDPQARHDFDRQANQEWADAVEFQKLDILISAESGTKANIEFRATFKATDGTEHIHHEFSKFRKQAGTWYFRDGKVVAEKTDEEA